MWFSVLLQGSGLLSGEVPNPSTDNTIKQPQRDLPSGIRGGSDLWDDQFSGGTVLRSDWFHAPDIPMNSRLKVWNGTDWQVGVLKVWNGTDWQVGVLKVWNGTTWVS